MFNVPLPTDSLYKFAFMFGLLLIVYSLYFKEKQLSKFDKSQSFYVIDSLTTKRDEIDSRLSYEDSLLDNMFFSTIWAMNGDSVVNYNLTGAFFEEFEPMQFTTFNTQQYKKYFIAHPKDEVKRDFFTDKFLPLIMDHRGKRKLSAIKFNREIDFFKQKIKNDRLSFYSLLGTGIVLFIGGIVCWYFLVQKLQDTILLVQFREAKRINIKNNLVPRKHYESKIVSRRR